MLIMSISFISKKKEANTLDSKQFRIIPAGRLKMTLALFKGPLM